MNDVGLQLMMTMTMTTTMMKVMLRSMPYFAFLFSSPYCSLWFPSVRYPFFWFQFSRVNNIWVPELPLFLKGVRTYLMQFEILWIYLRMLNNLGTQMLLTQNINDLIGWPDEPSPNPNTGPFGVNFLTRAQSAYVVNRTKPKQHNYFAPTTF